ncbi:uncharacterized protein LOC111041481 [Myzus persicae]|uniref:uncharacterized protein LOC111041481 n=1 Tax=Myzus persicae TaxID=13164 RepID=UPI000B936E5F|nr:uncharacterized protein LOC111041481 [Myzus persicae]XP_022181449.1 uncharacterized protein LOC111041481 [Myzus persicae]
MVGRENVEVINIQVNEKEGMEVVSPLMHTKGSWTKRTKNFYIYTTTVFCTIPCCHVCGESRNNKSKVENITFHRCPVNVPLIKKIGNQFVLKNSLSLNNITKHSVHYSAHFHPSSFLDNNKIIKLLKKNAIPPLIVSRVKSAQNDYSKMTVPIPGISNSAVQQGSGTSYKVQKKLVKVSCVNYGFKYSMGASYLFE